MRRRWSRQEFVRVEDYLPQQRSEIPNTALLDIVYGEYILSKEYGLGVDHAEYFRRFPEIESALRRQFAVDDALSSDIPCAFESTMTGSGEPAPLAEPIPERIGKYVVVGRIGVGGQAEIFRAVHPALGKEVVLKRAASRTPLQSRQSGWAGGGGAHPGGSSIHTWPASTTWTSTRSVRSW